MYNILSAIHAIYNRGYAQHHEWLANNMSWKYPHVFEIELNHGYSICFQNVQ